VDRVVVAVESTDLILLTGLCVVLRQHPLLRVTADVTEADVLVRIEDALTEASLATMQKARVNSPRAQMAPYLLITKSFPPPLLLPAIEAGVVAVVPRTTSANEIAQISVEITNGSAHLTPRLQRVLLSHFDRIRSDILAPNNLTITGLSHRERDVLTLISQGLETAEVAQRMRYSERTVKNILHKLMTRLELQNRAHAVAYAIKIGAI